MRFYRNDLSAASCKNLGRPIPKPSVQINVMIEHISLSADNFISSSFPITFPPTFESHFPTGMAFEPIVSNWQTAYPLQYFTMLSLVV